MSQGLKFLEAEVSTEIIAEGGSERDEIRNGKIFLEELVFNTDEDFLLAGTARKITASSAVTGTSKA